MVLTRDKAEPGLRMWWAIRLSYRREISRVNFFLGGKESMCTLEYTLFSGRIGKGVLSIGGAGLEPGDKTGRDRTEE